MIIFWGYDFQILHLCMIIHIKCTNVYQAAAMASQGKSPRNASVYVISIWYHLNKEMSYNNLKIIIF